MRLHLSDSKSLIIILVAINLFPLRLESYPLSEEVSFCSEYADKNTGILFNNYLYERTKNYNYCMRNAEYLIDQYENPLQNFRDNINNLKYEIFDRRREEKEERARLDEERAKLIKEREDAQKLKNARIKYIKNISDNLENIFD